MDDTLCHFEKAFHKSVELNPKQPYPQSQWGFFLGLEPYDGAIEGFRKLEEKYDVWILTKPSTKNLNCYTEKAKWIYDHLGQDIVDKLIICPDKSLIKGDYLIDDRLKNGAEEFRGELLRFGWAYETETWNEYPTWESILEKLL